MNLDARKKVVFVMSTNYAGSTVLGLVLGGHSRAAVIGEPASLLKRSKEGWRHKKYCSLCQDDGSKCQVWDADLVAAVRENPSQVYSLFDRKIGGECDVFVDGSKDLAWLDACVKEKRADPWIIHISKPVESYLASILTRREGGTLMEYSAISWARLNRQIREYATNRGIPYLFVRYPEFATRTDDFVRKLSQFLGLEAEPDCSKFWEFSPHYVKGNPGVASHFDRKLVGKEPGLNKEIYTENHQKIFLDEKWKRLIGKSVLDRVYSLREVCKESETLGFKYPLSSRSRNLAQAVLGGAMGEFVSAARFVTGADREKILS